MKVEVDYGIEASCVGLRCIEAIQSGPSGPAPTVGYFLTAVRNVPVWDWGGRKSKLRQAEVKQGQADLELSAARRQLVKHLHAAYNETQTALEHLDTLRCGRPRSRELAAEHLSISHRREATALEVVDTLNSLTQARDALDDGELRYRVAVANLQTFTGSF